MFVCACVCVARVQNAADNIMRTMSGRALKRYSPHSPFMVLVLGPSDGIILPPFGFNCFVLWGLIASLSKSRHLLISRFWWVLNAKRPQFPQPVLDTEPTETSTLLHRD